MYVKTAPALAATAANRVIDDSAMVTHVVTASCTGCHAPDIGAELVARCRLRSGVQRYHLGFMGCAAGLPALRLAQSICRSDPEATVLVVCVETSSVHLQLDGSTDALLTGALFADGAAAALVTARPVSGTNLRLDRFCTSLEPAAAEAMEWTIGDHGFVMRLSRELPELVAGIAPDAMAELLQDSGLTVPDLRHWAVHPGGKSILDRFEIALHLFPDALLPSRRVLARYGNMSSPTILFVLEQLLATAQPGPLCAIAFAPGLTVESALMWLEE